MAKQTVLKKILIQKRPKEKVQHFPNKNILSGFPPPPAKNWKFSLNVFSCKKKNKGVEEGVQLKSFFGQKHSASSIVHEESVVINNLNEREGQGTGK